jgi:hypothetical protein
MEEAALRAHMGWEAFIVEEVAAFMVAVEAASMVAEAAVAIENSSPITAAERHKSASPSGMLLGSKEDFSCVI